MASPTVKIETNLTPGTLGMRYGSVVVLDPILLSGAAWVFFGSKRVGPAINRGAVARAPLRKARRPKNRREMSADSVSLFASLSFWTLLFMRDLLKTSPQLSARQRLRSDDRTRKISCRPRLLVSGA